MVEGEEGEKGCGGGERSNVEEGKVEVEEQRMIRKVDAFLKGNSKDLLLCALPSVSA